MINNFFKKYAISEKERLDNPKTYFLLKKTSLSRRGILILAYIFLAIYITTALLLNGKVCYFFIYVVTAFIGATGVWALIHQKVYKYVFRDELDECKLYVSTMEKFMMKYLGTLLGLLTISISVFIFLYLVGIVRISFIPESCSLKKSVEDYDNYKEAIQKCIDKTTLDIFLLD